VGRLTSVKLRDFAERYTKRRIERKSIKGKYKEKLPAECAEEIGKSFVIFMCLTRKKRIDMKYIIILGDGMADHPIKRLGNKTPLQVANIPNIDKLAKMGRCGLFQSVPLDMPPGSEVANLAVLGYNVHKVYEGRGVLEGASMGVEINEGDLAMRCNLICIEEEKIKNHSAGHISTEESHILIDFLNEKLSNDFVKFHKGISYRHLFVLKNGNNDLEFTPPHDVPSTSITSIPA